MDDIYFILMFLTLGFVRSDILLLPDYVPTPSRRPIWHHLRALEGRPPGLSRSDPILCQVCLATPPRKALLQFWICKGKMTPPGAALDYLFLALEFFIFDPIHSRADPNFKSDDPDESDRKIPWRLSRLAPLSTVHQRSHPMLRSFGLDSRMR